MRGKPLCSRPPTAGNRITPADAGKTFTQCEHGANKRDHPRGCGENLSFWVFRARQLGSPPRMRGKPRTQNEQLRNLRITPADAGKTQLTLHKAKNAKDHPRGCGENRLLVYIFYWRKGSPPRMRGKLSYVQHGDGSVRITPADAGKTLIKSDCKALIQDHPRGCGENVAQAVVAGTVTGSPPRMRGKHTDRA